jgi:flagellar hook-associated protein 1 FlgK
MPSTFLSLEIGLSALQASQLGAMTAGHNIANASTPGYAREVADLETETSLEVFTDHVNYLGQGVRGRGQDRVTDPSMDTQYRDANGAQNYWQTQDTEINNIGQIFNEPAGTTLRHAIDNFFSAWSQLANTPADYGARANVLQASISVADAFHVTASQLSATLARYSSELSASITDVNTILQNIANLNQQIILDQQRGTPANDLLDQRDAQLDKLSKYGHFIVTPQADGSVTVAAAIDPGSSLYATQQTVTLVSGGAVVGTVGYKDPTEAVDVTDMEDQKGLLRSLYDMQQYIDNSDGKSGILNQLNALANELITKVNAVYQPGYGLNGQTGDVLFTGTDASSIQVNGALTQDALDAIQASATDTTGGQNQTDGEVAQAIANLYTTYDTGAGVVSYAGIVTKLGVDGAAAKAKNQTASALSIQAQTLRDSVRGVDINEEMGNMIRFQQQYNAAAKFVSIFNDMLDTLIKSV